MEKLENKEELKKMLQELNPKSREDYVNYLLNNYTYFKLNDDYILTFEKNPTIYKDLWYDDEQPIPELTENLFINYNLRMEKGKYFKIEKKAGINPYYIYNYYNNKKQITLRKYNYLSDYLVNLEDDKKRNMFVKFLNNEEIKEYNLMCDELINHYIERLKKYYKKYYNNVHCLGYWANR